MAQQVGGAATVTTNVWLDVANPELTMDDAERIAVSAGNRILRRDDEHRRFLVARETTRHEEG